MSERDRDELPCTPQDNVLTPTLDRKLYIDNKHFFYMIQDAGDDMTLEEITDYDLKPLRNKPKKYKHIKFLYKYYKQLYILANEIRAIYIQRQDIFPTMIKNKYDCTHEIGYFIDQNRRSVHRNELYSVTDTEHAMFVNNPELKHKKSLWFVMQAQIITYFHTKWNMMSPEEMMKPNVSDKVRLMGLIFSDKLREYIHCLHSPNNFKFMGERRLCMDSYKPQKLSLWSLLLEAFKCKDELVVLPDLWKSPVTKEKIVEKFTLKVYDELDIDQNFFKEPSRFNLEWKDENIKKSLLLW